MFKSGVLLALQVSMLTFSACPRDGPVCIQGLNPTPTVFQLEARPRGGSHRCTQPTLGMGLNYANPPWAILLSQVRMQNANLVLIAPVWKSQAWYPILLALLVDYPCLLPAQETTILQMHTITLPIRGHEVQLAVWPISGDLAKRDSFSKEATSLLMASWRSKSQSSYNSLFHKWECWCNELNYANPPWAILLSQVRMQNANLVLIAPCMEVPSIIQYPILQCSCILVDYRLCLLPAPTETTDGSWVETQMHTITIPIRGHEGEH